MTMLTHPPNLPLPLPSAGRQEKQVPQRSFPAHATRQSPTSLGGAGALVVCAVSCATGTRERSQLSSIPPDREGSAMADGKKKAGRDTDSGFAFRRGNRQAISAGLSARPQSRERAD